MERELLPPEVSTLFFQPSEHYILKGLDALLHWAVAEHISDLHIEPMQSEVRIRIRMDGVLHSVVSLPIRYAAVLLSKVKMLAHLDIAEKRQPQDGRFELKQEGRIVNARISTCPTLFGEKAVLRLLALQDHFLDLIELGMTRQQLLAVEEVIQSPHGLVIVTGPTGSGKTMTLYSLLARLNQTNRNLISVEDPIEMVLPGMNQIQIQEKAGIDFKTILRSLLRQDPDVLMIGEIRDAETAEIAIKAAQTGHLVLSTLHTQSSRQALSRLEQLGIPHYLVLETARLFIAQRLVKKEEMRGRTGIFEMLKVSPERQDYVEGLDLYHAGLLKVKAGLCTELAVKAVI
ncbi:MAG: GspE/PulE family protein [Gammaproteobacteria bacterium]|nr:GspE/PulE family protein [Gammaproteobacteria bacterium]